MSLGEGSLWDLDRAMRPQPLACLGGWVSVVLELPKVPAAALSCRVQCSAGRGPAPAAQVTQSVQLARKASASLSSVGLLCEAAVACGVPVPLFSQEQ